MILGNSIFDLLKGDYILREEVEMVVVKFYSMQSRRDAGLPCGPRL